jgi:hypothetical protein
MRFMYRGGVALALTAVVAVFVGGCGQAENKQQASVDTKKVHKVEDNAPAKKAGEETKHEGWWCDEHGIPEAECSMCSKKVADACKAKGDWCEKHNRAKSQCFKCDPSLKEKFAARYRAMYNGKEPPPITDDD